MNLTEAAHLARQLMNEHGLIHVPFRWNRGKRMMGKTMILHNRITGEYIVQSISLSEHFVRLQREDEVRDTILHEIAHALTPGHGHDWVWRAKCREIGADQSRTKSSSATPEAAVLGVCPNGHETRGQHRLPLRVRTCGKCSSTFNLDYLISWSRNGRKVPISQMPQRYRDEHARIVARQQTNDVAAHLSNLFKT